jgi:hypothetical protein
MNGGLDQWPDAWDTAGFVEGAWSGNTRCRVAPG